MPGQFDSTDTATKALKMLRKGDFDLVICDWGMHHMSGFQLLETIQSESALVQVRVILIVTDIQENDAVTAGVQLCVVDSDDESLLRIEIEKVFDMMRESVQAPP